MNTVEEIKKNIYEITLPTPFLVGPVNCYLIKDEALTLVDTGPKTEATLKALEESLKTIGINIKDIEVVILTHHHPDHVGLLEQFLPQAKVYAHKKVEPWLKRDPLFLQNTRDFYKKLYGEHGMENELVQMIDLQKDKYLDYSAHGYVDVFLEEGKELEPLPKWSVMETPGHAQSHISLFRESDGIMLAGDHLIQHVSSNAIIEGPYYPGEERVKTLVQYGKSLEKCLHVKTAYSGHGVPVDNPKELILSRLDEHEKKASQFKDLMGDEPMTTFEICMRKYPHMYKKQPELTFSETLGHLDLLEQKGSVKKTTENGMIYYEAIA